MRYEGQASNVPGAVAQMFKDKAAKKARELEILDLPSDAEKDVHAAREHDRLARQRLCNRTPARARSAS